MLLPPLRRTQAAGGGGAVEAAGGAAAAVGRALAEYGPSILLGAAAIQLLQRSDSDAAADAARRPRNGRAGRQAGARRRTPSRSGDAGGTKPPRRLPFRGTAASRGRSRGRPATRRGKSGKEQGRGWWRGR